MNDKNMITESAKCYVAVDRNGQEWVYRYGRPHRCSTNPSVWSAASKGVPYRLPKGTIFKIFGEEMKWEHEPIPMNEDDFATCMKYEGIPCPFTPIKTEKVA